MLRFLILIVLLVFPASVYAQEKPYKATTVDECIQEKECVWFAFEKQLRADSEATGIYKRNYILKWNKSIKFSVRGKNAQKFLPLIVDVSKQLAPFIPININVNHESNFRIIYTDDIDKTFANIEPHLEQNMATKGSIRKWYEEIKSRAEGAVGLVLSDGSNLKNLGAVLTLIDINHPAAKHITAMEYYSAFGLGGYLEDQPFSLLSDKTKTNIKFTKLDKFLLFLLYQPEFKSGQSFEEVKDIFDKIYENTKTKFLEKLQQQQ
tara:strand:+ start:286 stop:1077 length:792 start_codon:yes stop_codon:yes gene_type:complete